jgi:protein TonB
MGKIVKYCSSCDEGFSEKFSFCPSCSASLQAYELNPVSGESTLVEEPASAAAAFIAEPPAGPTEADVTSVEQPIEAAVAEEDVDLEYDDSKYDYLDAKDEEPEEPVYAPAAAVPAGGDEGYSLTMIEEKNATQRNGLLLGATVFMIMFVAGATVWSLFLKPLDLSAIGDGTELAYLVDEVPTDTEEVKPKKDKDDGGGGGGGGKQEKDPASRGDLADQTPKPTRPPDVNTMKSDDPMLQTPTTQGNMKFPKVYNKWGLPNGLDGISSNGTGTGSGIGSGTGTGQGSGSGTGAGSGTGSGYGDGNGNGNGNGTGGGGGEPPAAVAKVTTPLKILFKPKATYTDEARTQNVQGNVTLKITLLANGSVGSITPVSRLPYGLTEQAIAAARQIKFEPKKVNGQPVAVTMTFQYGFNIY